MELDELRKDVWQANMGLVEAGLVVLTWGNASGVDRAAGVMAIKPSGVDYDRLRVKDIVLVSLQTGEVTEGDLRPSSDTPTHLMLYRAFGTIGGVVHTHSPYATSWAQARREIPCLGTTHADHFYGPVPLTRQLTAQEIAGDYEVNCGKVIVDRFGEEGLNPAEVPAVLLPGHGPFVWGASPREAFENAVALEETANVAFGALLIDPHARELPQELMDKHFRRKHDRDGSYGQEGGTAIGPSARSTG